MLREFQTKLQKLSTISCLGAILLLRKKNSGWMGSSNAYNCLFVLHKLAMFGPNLLVMWVGGLENGEQYAYVIKVCPLMELMIFCEKRVLKT